MALIEEPHTDGCEGDDIVTHDGDDGIMWVCGGCGAEGWEDREDGQ